MNPYVVTNTGKFFNFLQPHKSHINIGDIALALSNKCRWNGHCRPFYSVAEHSIHVARTTVEVHFKKMNMHRATNPTTESWCVLAGLLHDAAEAYIGDIAHPIKNYLYVFMPGEIESHRKQGRGSISLLEANTHEVITSKLMFKKVHISISLSTDIADQVVNRVEAATFFPSAWPHFDNYDPSTLPVDFDYWSPVEARDKWMEAYDNAVAQIDLHTKVQA